MDVLSNSNEILRTSNPKRETVGNPATVYNNLFQANEECKEPFAPMVEDSKLESIESINRQNRTK